MAGKSPRSELMRNRDFPPQAIQILGDVLRNKEKSRLFKYIYIYLQRQEKLFLGLFLINTKDDKTSTF